jgi:hypothetical protein
VPQGADDPDQRRHHEQTIDDALVERPQHEVEIANGATAAMTLPRPRTASIGMSIRNAVIRCWSMWWRAAGVLSAGCKATAVTEDLPKGELHERRDVSPVVSDVRDDDSNTDFCRRDTERVSRRLSPDSPPGQVF